MAQVPTRLCSTSLAVLQDAVQHGETFFIKVHAAENLIYHQHTQGLEAEFLQLKSASPDNAIGAARVLGRLNKNNAATYQRYISELLELFQQGSTDRVRLTALESLGKLGYREALPGIVAAADTGTNGYKSMARWILANRNTVADESRLAEMLLSHEIADYRTAAYALRFKPAVSTATVARLKQCLQSLLPDDAARVYVTSSLFVHSTAAGKAQLRPALLGYAASREVNQRYEAAEALGTGGSTVDWPVLGKLLTDENTDVRVAAANALLRLAQRNND